MANINNMGGGGEPSILGSAGAPISTAKSSLGIDAGPLKKLTEAFGELNKVLRQVEQQMKSVKEAADSASASVSNVANGGQGGNVGAAGTKMASFKSTTQAAGDFMTDLTSKGGSGGGGGGGGGVIGKIMGAADNAGIDPKALGKASVFTAIGDMAAKGMAAIDARVDRGRDHALSADRMSVLYQQMTGLSQQQVTQQYRMPLTEYRLGSGGINELLELQSRTGINANQQAASVEAMRTYSGFSLSTGGAADMMENLTSAPVANRMFMMMGGGMVGPGGKHRDMQDVMENIVKTAGLTDERLVKGGMAAGSITRSRLASMGVAPEMQDMVLQYAQQNIQYRKKGGQGMYDASSEESRKLMGIEDNFATQAEETERIRNQRDERFYSRQADNYADLEKQTQKLVKVFTELEDKLSGIIGQRTSNRIGMKIAGTALQILGAGVAIAGAIPSGGGSIALGAGIAAGGTALRGDPYPASNVTPKAGSTPPKKAEAAPSGAGATGSNLTDDQIKVPTYGSPMTLNQVKNTKTFKGLHPNMQDRLLKMMRANPNVGFGEGHRSYQDQKTLFTSRYHRVNYKTNIEWDGSYWEKNNSSDFAAAPPGRSMHAIGLAADLVGDLDWVVANAHRFGLQHFLNVNNEKHHVQPAELPPGFGDYIKAGAAWGTGDNPTGVGLEPPTVGEGAFDTPGEGSDGHTTSGGGGGTSAGSISYEAISARVAKDPSNLGGGSGSGGGAGTSGSGGSSTNIATKINVPTSGAMPGADVARLLHGAGFRGRDLIKMLAIAYRESSFNPRAHNPNRSSGDNSYGLFQINMIDDIGEYRKRALGLNSYEDLFDPHTNIRAMKMLWDDGVKNRGGNGFYHWGDYPNSGPGTSDGGLDIPTATKIVTDAKLQGDPIPDMRAAASMTRPGTASNISVKGGHTFNISVPLSVVGSAAPNDLHRVAKEVARLIQREIQLNDMRSS